MTAPIVITLKKRLGPASGAPPPQKKDDLSGSSSGDDGDLKLGSKSRSRSRSRSPGRSEGRSASAPSVRPLAASSLLGTDGLNDLVSRFRRELDGWVKVETGKLERAEAAGKSSREELRRVATQVCDILDNQAPEMDLGADARGDAFAAKALPKFLQLVDSDLRDLEETTGLIRGFAEKHFAKQEDEVARIRSQEASPAGMLRSVLRLAAMALATKAEAPRAEAPKASGRRRRRASAPADGEAPPATEGRGRRRRRRREGAEERAMSCSTGSESDV